MKFELQPHDTPRDEMEPPFEAVTKHKWSGANYFLGRGEGFKGMETTRILLFQRQNGPLLRAVEFSRLNIEAETPDETTVSDWDESAALCPALSRVGKARSWARLFYLNEDAHLRRHGEEARFAVLLTAQGWARWRVLRQTGSGRFVARSEAHFWWKPEGSKEFRTCPASALWLPLRADLDDPDSPLGFARRWAGLSKSERNALLWRFERGNEEELRKVLRDLLLCQTKWWQTPRHLVWHSDFHDRDDARYPQDGKSKPRRTKTFTASLERVWNWFNPRIDQDAYARHLELLRLFMNELQSIRIEIREPTMHEQMEAVLSWRDWLEKTAP